MRYINIFIEMNFMGDIYLLVYSYLYHLLRFMNFLSNRKL